MSNDDAKNNNSKLNSSQIEIDDTTVMKPIKSNSTSKLKQKQKWFIKIFILLFNNKLIFRRTRGAYIQLQHANYGPKATLKQLSEDKLLWVKFLKFHWEQLYSYNYVR